MLHESSLVYSYQHFPENRGSFEVLTNAIRTDSIVMHQFGGYFLESSRQNLIKKKHIVNSLRMLQHSLLILRMVESECWFLVHPLKPRLGLRGIQGGEVRRNAGVQPTDNSVQNLLLFAHVVVVLAAAEAVLLVNELPDGRAIVVCIRLDVRKDVEVLTLVVLLVLYLPNPLTLTHPLSPPLLLPAAARGHPIEMGPNRGNILLVAAANATGSGLTEPPLKREWALLVEVEPDDAEKFGLD